MASDALERGTFHFRPPCSDPTLISYFRLHSITGQEAKRVLPIVHFPTNDFHKTNRPQGSLHRFHKSSPSTRISFTLSTSAVIGTTRLPLFLRFGCSWIFTAHTAISLVHPWTFMVTRCSKQAPARILARMQELAIRSTRLHPRTCFSAAENWLIIRGFPSMASGVKTAIMPLLGSTFRPVSRFEAWTRVEKSAFGEGIKTEATDFAPCNEA